MSAAFPEPTFIDDVTNLGGGVAGLASVRGVYLVVFDQAGLDMRRPLSTISLIGAVQLADYVSVQAHREPRLAILAAKCWRAHLELVTLHSDEPEPEPDITLGPNDYTVTLDGSGLSA